MKMGTGRTVALTVAIMLLLLALAGLAAVYSGAYNVAATAEHAAFTRRVLNTAQRRSVAARADEVAARPPLDTASLVHGFDHFRAMCVVCHGAPGVERGEFGQGMTPTPPDLSDMADLYSPAELFWVVKHGIKLAGMPAFGPTHSDEEIWGIVAFLERLPEMSPEEYGRWLERYAPPPGEEGHGSASGHTDPPDAPPHTH